MPRRVLFQLLDGASVEQTLQLIPFLKSMGESVEVFLIATTPIFKPSRDFVICISGHANGFRRSMESFRSFVPEARGVLG